MKQEVLSVVSAMLLVACGYKTSADSNAESWLPLNIGGQTERNWRAKSPTSFATVSLDLDGDKVADRAALVVSGDAKRSGIEICYGKKSASQDCVVIAVEENIAEVMGLEKRKPGCYDYIDSDSLESSPKIVCSESDILDYFRFGSSGSFFLYDQESRTLKRYWDSD